MDVFINLKTDPLSPAAPPMKPSRSAAAAAWCFPASQRPATRKIISVDITLSRRPTQYSKCKPLSLSPLETYQSPIVN